MTGKKWYRLGVWLLVFGVVLMLVGVFFGYRYLVELPIPAVLHDPLEEAAGAGRIGGALILCGPGVILGLIGYALIEKFGDHQWD